MSFEQMERRDVAEGNGIQPSVRTCTFSEMPFLLPPSVHCKPTPRPLTNAYFGKIAAASWSRVRQGSLA